MTMPGIRRIHFRWYAAYRRVLTTICSSASSWERSASSRSPSVFLGYYKNPEATAAALRDGWLHSGDTGFLDADGHLVFFDRHGWYCVHGRDCPAVQAAQKCDRKNGRTTTQRTIRTR